MAKIQTPEAQVKSWLSKLNYQIEIRPHMTRLKRTGLPAPPKPSKTRGVVRELSVASGQRLQNAITSVNPEHGAPFFITLTYPYEYPGSAEVWKRHLDNFRRSLKDVPGDPWIGAIWRLEAQKRGAPHYHILLWHRLEINADVLRDFRRWLSKTWYRIVGSGDEKHLKAGTECQQVEGKDAIKGVSIYLAKYLGKDSVHPKSQVFNHPVGRYWGVWNKKQLLLQPELTYISKDQYLKIRRVFRGIREKCEKEKRNKPGYVPKKLRSKEDFNRCKKKQVLIPGTKCFICSEEMEKLLRYVDPPPF